LIVTEVTSFFLFTNFFFMSYSGEEFKIKKSRESRRMTKEKKKERKTKDDQPFESKSEEIIIKNDNEILFNEGIKCNFFLKLKFLFIYFFLLVKPLKQTNKLDEGLRNLTFKSEAQEKSKKFEVEEIIEEDSEEEEERIRVKA
jgi:hypothetical protein